MNELQARVLTHRYMDTMLGAPGHLLLLLLQAPVIGGVLCLAYADAAPDERMRFFLCLAAMWCGCMNSCREIVKERPIYERERMLFLQLGPYLCSKYMVLGWIALFQSLCLAWLTDHFVGLRGWWLLYGAVLFCVAMCGTGWGLAVSALAGSQDKAVGLVPMVLLPQILFHRLFLPASASSLEWVQRSTALHWGGRLLELAASMGRWEWLELLGNAAGMCGVLAATLMLPLVLLWLED